MLGFFCMMKYSQNEEFTVSKDLGEGFSVNAILKKPGSIKQLKKAQLS